tara:strand:+ start:1401 stop:2144 length:744 start_codon:yes stop_codon:yes gene_type:complete
MSISKIFSKIISTIFPEFTNKLTWAVVAAGLALISSSLVEQIIRAAINENLNWNLTDGNDAIIGVVLISLGLLHNYGFVREKNKPQHDQIAHEKLDRELEHDKTIYSKLNEYIEEGYLINYIESILTNHSYTTKESEPLDYFYYEGNKFEYNFINFQINQAKDELLESFKNFEDFKSTCFFSHGLNRSDGQLYMCMHPYWNIDRGGYPTREEDKKYDDCTKKLIQLGELVQSNYKNYRSKVKSALAI